MKIAIYCTGFLRSFKTNAVNLRKALLDKFDCDLYFYTISNEFECDSYFNENSAFEYIQKELKPKVFIYEKEDLNQPITTRIRRMWFKVKFINDMRNDIEKRDNFRYDLIIRMRPDILLTDIEKLENYILCFSGEKLLLPKFDSKSYPSLCIDNFNGYNDQFAIGCRSLIDIYCSLFDYISDYNKQGVLNSSSLLKYHLEILTLSLNLLITFIN